MNTTAQVKQTIKKFPQQFVDPLEILSTAKDQVLGSEQPQEQVNSKIFEGEENNIDDIDKTESLKKQSAEQDGRRLEDLETELRDIRRQNIFKDLTQKIQSGVSVPLEEFSELNYEQKDVLKAQMEVFKKQQAEVNVNTSLIEPIAKQGRKFIGGMNQKKAAEKQQTRVESPVQSST